MWGTCQGVSAQAASYEILTIEHGLSQGMIFDLCQTRDGFLWVATKDGLNRYDGYNFKVFTNNPFDPYALAENTVMKIFEDRRGLLWLGLENKGVDVYDPKTGRFHHFSVDIGTGTATGGTSIVDMVENPKDGSLWVFLRNGGVLSLAWPAAWTDGLPAQPALRCPATPLAASLPPPISEKMDLFENLACRSNGDLLVFTDNTLYVVEPGKQTARRWENLETDSYYYQFKQMETQGQEVFWFVRAKGGQIDFLRLQNGRVEAFPVRTHSNADLLQIFPLQNGQVYLAIGPNVWAIAPGETPDFSKPDLRFDATPTMGLIDRTGNTWIGTLGHGLRKINALQGHFRAGAAGWSFGGVWANTGRYFAKWVLDIRSFDPQTGLWATQTAFPDAPPKQIGLSFDPSGAIWLLGMTVEDTPRAVMAHYPPHSTAHAERRCTLDLKVMWAEPLCRARDGRIWIAGLEGRIALFDPATERATYFEMGHLFDEKVKSVRALAIAEDESGTLWVGTQLGLVKGERKADGFDFQLIQAGPDKPDGLNNNAIACLLPQPNGQLWMGTKGGGINILDAQTGRFRHITTADGLLNDVVYGILPGNSPLSGVAGGGGEFWCSTNRGLAKIMLPRSPGKNGGLAPVITTYTAALGLQDNEFNTQAFSKADNGELLFGGVNGLNHFFPEQLRPDTTPPPIYLVGIEINHQKAATALLGAPPESLSKLRLGHDQNNLSIEFAALDFTDPSKNRYRYRLVGLDDDWVETGNRHFAHFSHLAPGTYEFRVQGNNGESAWLEAKPLTIIVYPPWYRSNLAYFCYLLILAWAAWKAYQFQIRRVKEREQLAFEQRETERIKALEQLKTNFFSNVTHEFRTPLTLIVEPVRQILKNPQDPHLLDKARLIEKNSQQLQDLVNQLLDMAKLEAGQMALDLRRGDLAQTLRDLFGRFLPLAEKRGVKLTLRCPANADWATFDFDGGKVEMVLNNLISNALKFTPAGGTVEVQLTNHLLPSEQVVGPESKIQNPKSKIQIQVRDTGIGIPPEALNKVFDRFYQVDGSGNTRTNEGTGIGLALSKELAELMGGGILVESPDPMSGGKGSTFTFWMPVSGLGATKPDNKGDKMDALEVWAPAPATPALAPRPEGPVPIALVIEDNAELRHFIKQSIETDWQVVEASDGEEGIQKALELLPDLVISDLMMPRRDGYAVCDALKSHELTAHIPVILLTAKSSLDAKLQGLRRGADDYLTKPFHTEELLARMENLVEARRRLRAHYAHWAAQAPAPEASGGEAPLPESDRAFLNKMAALIETRLDEEGLSVDLLAEAMFLSRSQLYRKLMALTGQSPTDFVREHRLARAYSMLRNREGNVTEVSDRCGFGNEKYFSRVFKEKYGFPPSKMP